VRSPSSADDVLGLFFTDVHLSGHRPRWRTDDYVKTIMTKLEEVGQIAKKTGAPRVLFGGDLTEGYMIGLPLGDQAIDVMESWDMPTYFVVGNHDLAANSLDTLHRTWIGHIFRRSRKIRQLKRIVDGNTAIVGVHFNDGVEEYLASSEHKFFTSDCFYSKLFDHNGNPTGEASSKPDIEHVIEVIHAMILPKGELPNSRCVAVDDVKTLAHMVLSGDYHNGWDDVINRMDMVKFVNPGALTRKEASSSDLSRMPRVALIRRNLDVEYIELKSASPPEDVFDIDMAMAEKERKQSLDEYMHEIRDVQIAKVNVRKRIEAVAAEMKASKAVKITALNEYDKHVGEM
jgi:hypothetical protein